MLDKTIQMTHFEHGRRVVVDRVDARGILPEEERATQEQAPHDTLVAAGGLEGLPESKTDSRALLLQGLVYGTNFLNHIDVGLVQLAHPAKVFDSLLAAITSE